jgi:hypothetical protein
MAAFPGKYSADIRHTIPWAEQGDMRQRRHRARSLGFDLAYHLTKGVIELA